MNQADKVKAFLPKPIDVGTLTVWVAQNRALLDLIDAIGIHAAVELVNNPTSDNIITALIKADKEAGDE